MTHVLSRLLFTSRVLTVPSARVWVLGLVLALAAGAGFRLIWGWDIEYKPDEVWMFHKSQTVGRTEPLPWLGMPSCSNFANPGLNVWLFTGLGWLMNAQHPPDLARGVQILSILAMLLWLVFVFRWVPERDREPWLWALALMAVNPLAVLFHRKIWQPSLFPLFTLAMLTGWWRRGRPWGAFVWGLVGALLGQVQMAGFFFAAGFVLWALLFDRKSVRWRWWFCGSVLGTLPMIPWLYYMFSQGLGHATGNSNWSHIFEGKFWFRWITEPFGISLNYSLEQDFDDFLRYPLIGGGGSYLVLALHGLLFMLTAVILGRALYLVWQSRGQWRSLGIGRDSETAFTQNAALWGFGWVMTISTMSIHRHYLLVAMPLTFLWLARSALAQRENTSAGLRLSRTLLLALCLTQGLITAHFLAYIHVNQRKIDGDYGKPYRAQVLDNS